MAADVALRPRLQQQPLLTQFAGEIGDPRGAQRRDGAVRLAVGQVDHGKPCGDLRARRTLQPLVDLILQQLAGLIEQVDRDQPVGEPADHFVAAPPDRRQLAIFIEHPERVDRRQVVALRTEDRAAQTVRPRRPGPAARFPNWAAAWLRSAPPPAIRRSARCRRRSSPSTAAPSARRRRRATPPKASRARARHRPG